MTISALANDTIQGYSGHTSGSNGQVTRLVVHCTVSPCQHGQARAVAHYFQSSSSGGLAHYVVDPDEIIACCDEDTSCWHAPPNKGSIGVELCGYVDDNWSDDAHERMLQRAAPLFKDIADRHGIPIVWLSPAELLNGQSGLTSHANVAQAWHKTDHTDPGVNFPVDHFMQLIAGNAPAPAPAPATEDIKVLHLIKGDKKPEWYVTDWITKMHVLSPDHANNIIVSTISGGGKISFEPNNQPHVFPQAWIDTLR